MKKVRVRYFTMLRELAGVSEEEVPMKDDACLGNLINYVTSKYGKAAKQYLCHAKGKVDPSIYIIVNGLDSKLLSGMETKLKDNDVVAIIPPVGGG